ncbi:MAG: DUF3794 domain-containing protein [Clostridia bacterium]|nr:DUF3794 domain-containing protein [Clostridia bacterium]
MENYSKGAFVPETFSICVCNKNIGSELSEDFTLPDYQPELRKLLKLTPILTPPAHYIGAGQIELSGNISYDVLYCGEDGQLYSARIPSTYSFETTMDDVADADMSEGMRVMASVDPESVTGRVMAPRKIGIRTRLGAHICAYAPARVTETITGLDDVSSLRRLLGRAEYADIIACAEESVPMGDEVIVEQREGEIRMIGADGRVFVSEASAANDCIMCRGELILGIMICREGSEEIECITRKLPFAREMSAPGVSVGDECRAWGECQTVNVSVGEGRLICEASMSLSAEAQKKQAFTYTRDIYSTAAPVEVVYADKVLTRPLRASNGNFTQSGVFDAAENQIPAGARIINADGYASVDSMTAERGRCVMTGEVRYNSLYADGEEYGCRELSQPWRYEADIGSDVSDGELDGSAELTVISCRARMDGERVSVDSEISAAWRACRPVRVKMPADARFSPMTEARRGDCIVCYPESSDTLWSVARRYRADADRVCANNSLTGDPMMSLAGVKYLII